MIITQPRKNRILLEDYNYQRDIQQRLFLSKLNVFETTVLHEIIDGSLTTNLENLADDLGVDENLLPPVLDKFVEIHLIQRQGKMLFVDKEMRKYFETHAMKFDEDFKPSLQFLQDLLSKIPLHVLPIWYSLPKTSDHIFQSILEKYMLTPRTYIIYLKQLTFEDPILNKIFIDIYSADDFSIKSKDIIKKYGLTAEQFAEYALNLEYHLVCCTSYRKIGNLWEEILTPFSEWHDYLLFQKAATPAPISEPVKPYHPDEFGFVKDMSAILNALEKGPLRIKEENEEYFFSDEKLRFSEYPKRHQNNLIAKLLQFKLLRLEKNLLISLHKAEEWEEKTLEEQAMIIYRHPGSCFRQLERLSITFTERDLREVERNLRRILSSGWVYFDDFIKGFTSPIGETEEMTLTHKGKRWAYNHPRYTETDEKIIMQTICGRLFESGMVAIGTHKERLAIRVTRFGQETFGES